MVIEKIFLNNLRNHTKSEVIANEGLNIFFGLNGAGKTTILEGISICSFSKSFLPVAESSLIRRGESYYQASVVARSELGTPYKAAVRYSPGAKKQINSTLGDNLLPKDIIGEMPVVVLFPDFKNVTFGAPQDRRQFIDRVLSQASKVYFEELMKFRRALKQRNNLLAQARLDRYFDFSQIEPWTDVLIKSGSELSVRRNNFVEEFNPIFKEIYSQVANGLEDVGISYQTDAFGGNKPEAAMKKEDYFLAYSQLFEKLKQEEIRRGRTLFGPQKDEFKIEVNSGVAREYASQGQHKSLLISITFAEFYLLKAKKNETPVVLLDDIFSELDKERARKVFELVANNAAQTFVTVTDPSILNETISGSSKSSFFRVSEGRVELIDNS